MRELRSVRRLRRRVSRSGRPPLPRPAGGLRRLRPADLVRGRRRATVEGTDAAIAAAQAALARGEIVAIKGLGGYHLACDATSTDGRRRRCGGASNGWTSPWRSWSPTWTWRARLADVDPAEAVLLTSPERPIVLVRPASGHAAAVSRSRPDNPHIGVLLPYTPLHHLLFRAGARDRTAPVPTVLVMTSGNLTDEPICYDDADARQRLGRIADAWLIHDRPIHVPCDDSVVRIDDGEELPIRRSRGYAPLPVRLPFELTPTLATGGELKNTFCLASGRDAWMSQHIGDMGSLETLAAFERSTGQFAEMYQVGGPGGRRRRPPRLPDPTLGR